MFALAALIAFILSPFVEKIGPWPMVTIGLALLAVHLLWNVALPIGRRTTTT